MNLPHGILKGNTDLFCGDEQNPRNKGQFVTGVRLVRVSGNGLIVLHEGKEWELLLCEACLEAVIKVTLGGNELELA